jgi:FAD/FMN-containing dehydrogenase
VSTLLERRLRRETTGEVLFDAASRGRYATDASIYQVMPVGVLVPKQSGDIVTAIDIARDLEVPILSRGGGTSQCGQTVGAALVIDNSKYFRQLFEVDVANRTACVQPGIVLDHLNAQLKQHGLWFPVDVSTSAQATLGGMAGNNSCGSRSLAYGNMVHNVLGATAWLSDSSRVRCRGQSPRKAHRRFRARAGGAPSRGDRGKLAESVAACGRLQPRYFSQPE